MPLHLAVRMVVSTGQILEFLETDPKELHITPWTMNKSQILVTELGTSSKLLETGPAQLRAEPSAGIIEMIRLPLRAQ